MQQVEEGDKRNAINIKNIKNWFGGAGIPVWWNTIQILYLTTLSAMVGLLQYCPFKVELWPAFGGN